MFDDDFVFFLYYIAVGLRVSRAIFMIFVGVIDYLFCCANKLICSWKFSVSFSRSVIVKSTLIEMNQQHKNYVQINFR